MQSIFFETFAKPPFIIPISRIRERDTDSSRHKLSNFNSDYLPFEKLLTIISVEIPRRFTFRNDIVFMCFKGFY